MIVSEEQEFVFVPVCNRVSREWVGEYCCDEASNGAGCLGRHARTEERRDERRERVCFFPLVRNVWLVVFFFKFVAVHFYSPIAP